MSGIASDRKRRLSQGSQDDASEQKRERTEKRQQPLASKTCAKWCHGSSNSGAQFDKARIKNLLPRDERNHSDILRDILSGAMVSGQVHPLIFESAADDDGEVVRRRSLPFFEELLVDRDRGRDTYRSLHGDMQRIVAVGVRDLYLAAWQGHVDIRERNILNGMVRVIGDPVDCVLINGLNVSYYPSANFKVLKFVENLDHELGPELAPFFAQVLETPRLFVVFVDPAELSYHNFENIVPLDRWIETRGYQDLTLSFSAPQQLKADREVFTCTLKGQAGGLLKELSLLDLYTPPLNKGTRGGERFIFHSTVLSKALSEAIPRSGILNAIAGGKLASSFEFANYVIRCNRFSPGDERFTSHLDTPYYDSSRGHISKYTILIYLTSGSSGPALRIGDVELYDIEEMTCVIFDQKLEHEGQSFLNGKKVFIRSELVFKEEYLAHDSRIASLFSTACYLTGLGVFDEELAQHAHECFERANSLHWAVESKLAKPPVYLSKTFRGMQFVTNGYDYWFSRHSGIKLSDCAMIATLDYLNCKISGKPFRSLCDIKLIRRVFAQTAEIWSIMEESHSAKAPLKRLSKADINPLIQKRAKEPFFKRDPLDDFESDSEEEKENDPCCPFHCYRTFNAWEDKVVWDEYKTCWKYTRKQLFAAPLVVLGQELFINESQIQIEGDRAFVLRSSDTAPLPPLNFAACWADLNHGSMITTDSTISTLELLVPPILFHEFEAGFHLVLDLFRNDWMVRVDDAKKVDVPVISNDLSEGIENSTFWSEIGFDSDAVPQMSDDDSEGLLEWSENEIESGDGGDIEADLEEGEDGASTDTSKTF